MQNTWLTKTLNIKYPIIVAPMFLVSNEEMIISALKAGITACIPAHNYRSVAEFESGLENIIKMSGKGFGVNLIANKSNIHLYKQLEACLKKEVAFIITSLGSPKKIIEEAHKKNILVFCDVTNVEYAKKVEALGADALIAVHSGAGGHAGNIPATVLIPMLKKQCHLPVIGAGGVGSGSGILSMFALGVEGLSMGTPFIATTECGVNKDYKDAVVSYHAEDIVMTSKLSGTPCTVINTPYMKKLGTDQNLVESFLNKNKRIKKYAKMLTYYKGMKLLEKAAFGATYKSVWCAGPSLEFSDQVKGIQELVDELVADYNNEVELFKKFLG